MLFHFFQRLCQGLLGECLAAHYVSEKSANCTQTGSYESARRSGSLFLLLRVLRCNNFVHFFVQVLQHELALLRLMAPRLWSNLLERFVSRCIALNV
jgi:hypothetical protein